MRNPIRRYHWGSTQAIPELLGVTPDGRPQAELWMGAYETESSQVRIDRRWHDLAAVLQARGEPRLPFLAKVIAIGEPLSLQIHPATGPEAKAEMLYAWQRCSMEGNMTVLNLDMFDDESDWHSPSRGAFRCRWRARW